MAVGPGVGWALVAPLFMHAASVTHAAAMIRMTGMILRIFMAYYLLAPLVLTRTEGNIPGNLNYRPAIIQVQWSVISG